MGIQCRPETRFRDPGQEIGRGQAEALDLMREVGAMLLLAQERGREGKPPTKPGEGKWYTSKPRWGGGSGGEMGDTGGNSDDAAATKPDEKKSSSSRMRSRKLSAAEAYKELRPGSGTWDPKVTYLAVGKEENSEFDNVSLPFSPF